MQPYINIKCIFWAIKIFLGFWDTKQNVRVMIYMIHEGELMENYLTFFLISSFEIL